MYKIMREDTAYDLMKTTRSENPANFRDNFVRKMLGLQVSTAYNNLTYRIDGVDFAQTPRSTFQRKGVEINYVDYYAQVN